MPGYIIKKITNVTSVGRDTFKSLSRCDIRVKDIAIAISITRAIIRLNKKPGLLITAERTEMPNSITVNNKLCKKNDNLFLGLHKNENIKKPLR